MRKWAILAALFLSGCDRPITVRTADQPSEVCRYQVAPVGELKVFMGGGEQSYAWRIDTKTGTLWFCTYTYTVERQASGQPLITCETNPSPKS